MEDPSAIIEQTLSKLSPAFAADGYTLRLGEVQGELRAEIVLEIEPDACAVCLVPDSVLLEIIMSGIQEHGAWPGTLSLRKIGAEPDS
jgi:hypothetical protein